MDQRFWLHPEYAALIDRCRENHADVAPRLVLADWIEENDEGPWKGRPEHIRMSCVERTSLEAGESGGWGKSPDGKVKWPDCLSEMVPPMWRKDMSRMMVAACKAQAGWVSEVWCDGDQFADACGLAAVAHPLRVIHVRSEIPIARRRDVRNLATELTVKGSVCVFKKTVTDLELHDRRKYLSDYLRLVSENMPSEMVRGKNILLHFQWLPMGHESNAEYASRAYRRYAEAVTSSRQPGASIWMPYFFDQWCEWHDEHNPNFSTGRQGRNI